MNGKDAKAIAQILAVNFCDDDFCEAIFKIDRRIEPHYSEKSAMVNNWRQVKVNYERQLQKLHGPDWESKATEAEKAAALDSARRLIYGDENDPKLFVGEVDQ